MDTNQIDRSPGEPINREELESLIMWPEGSIGERQERCVLGALLEIANSHGYGRLSQLASQIENLWMHPENIEEYNRQKAEHLKMCYQRPIDIKNRR